MAELGIEHIKALSPHAKGRIEPHSAKYSAAPADPDDAYVDIGETDLDTVFASRSIRKADNSSIRHGRKVYASADASDALPPHETR